MSGTIGTGLKLNERALAILERMLRDEESFRVACHQVEGGGRWIDCGVSHRGGLAAGLMLAEVCLAGLGSVSLCPVAAAAAADADADPTGLAVQVVTDHPVAACLASQYAGWAIQVESDRFFAMGSGPMRAAAGREALFESIGHRESSQHVVGVLEGRKPPTSAVFARIADACGVSPASVLLLVAPTASLAGTLQIVARSVETALHKLVELKFDLARVVAGRGLAPLPPIARNDLAAIGWTNDAILYGASVTLFVTGDDASLAEIGPAVPSTGSKDHGEPFSSIFRKYNHDFYAVDPMLFSPAQITFQNIETGRTHHYGRLAPEVLSRSFGSP